MFSKYTERLKDLMENPQTNVLLEKSLSSYPVYNPQKLYDMIPNRSELNKKVLNHYKYYEIGFETVGRFLDELEITMCEIMPHYNELFKTIEIMCELPSPFDNVDVIEEYMEERNGQINSESIGEGSSSSERSEKNKTNISGIDEQTYKKVGSDTPQSVLNETSQIMEDIKYASGIEWYKANNSNDSESNNDSNSKDENVSMSRNETTGHTKDTISHTFTKKGNQGVNTYAHDMNEFRTSIIDVVNQIINDERIRNLFMLVW